MWTAYRQFDYPDRGDIGAVRKSTIDEIKAACLEKTCKGFSLRDGQAWLKQADYPLAKEDLTFMGDGSVIFFTFGPPRELKWDPFPGCDVPSAGGDAEIVQDMDRQALMRYAESKGYVAFTVSGNQAIMKAFHLPPTAQEMQCLGGASYELFVSRPEAAFVGVSPYGITHQDFEAKCSKSAEDCWTTRCCEDPREYCFAGPSRSACLPWCDLSNQACTLVGSPRVQKANLFCFSVVPSDSSDFELVDMQLKVGVGLALCEDSLVFSDEERRLSNGDSTVALPGKDPDYVEAWYIIFKHFIWRVHDWLVKVDPQTVFVANQLKVHLLYNQEAMTKAANGVGLYLQTCSSGSPFGKAIKILNQDAAGAMDFHRDKCPPSDSVSEETWLSDCVKAVKANPFDQSHILLDNSCSSSTAQLEASACSLSHIAYYPMSSWESMKSCIKMSSELALQR